VIILNWVEMRDAKLCPNKQEENTSALQTHYGLVM